MNRKRQADIQRLERALQIWQVLIAAAYNRQILTYQIVADLIGVGSDGKGAIALRIYLGILMKYCDSRGLPPITALVVKKGGVADSPLAAPILAPFPCSEPRALRCVAREPAAQGRNLFLAYPALIPQRALRASEACRATIGRPAEAGLHFRLV